MRAVLVVNPQATSTTPGGRDVIAHALASDVKLDVVETIRRGHATEIAATASAEGLDLVVAHGGDGTVNEVVNGLLVNGPGHNVPTLGVVPGGSANVFARALGLPRDPVEATFHLLQAIEAVRSRSVGLGRAGEHWFTFNAGFGWDADVVAGVAGKRTKRASQALYARTALTRYFSQTVRGPRLTLELPGEQPIENMRLAFVSNTDPWTYLGDRPIRLNPQCSFDSGLGVFALHTLRATTVLRHVWQVLGRRPDPHGGNLFRLDDVARVRVSAREPVRLQIDGDLVGKRSSVEFVSVPDALQVAV
jgi:diacylglycerol kinase family enzyme